MELAARLCLAAVWTGVAWATLRGERSRGALVCGLGALSLAAAAALRWHVALHHAVRRALRDAGVYEQRIVSKLVIAGVVGLVVLGLARCVWKQPWPLRGALCAVLGFAAYLACYTALLDAYVPAALGRPPGRQLLELAFAAPALICATRWQRRGRGG